MLEGYKTHIGATAPWCQCYMVPCTFDFLYLTDGKEKTKS